MLQNMFKSYSPLPEAVTAVTARLVGGSCSVGVGFAWTMAANKPNARAEVLMMPLNAGKLSGISSEIQIVPFGISASKERGEEVGQLQQVNKVDWWAMVKEPTERVESIIVT